MKQITPILLKMKMASLAWFDGLDKVQSLKYWPLTSLTSGCKPYKLQSTFSVEINYFKYFINVL